MDDFTPTTEQVRSHYVFDQSDRWDSERGERFDRWLAEHDAEVRRRALRPSGAPAMREVLQQLLDSLDSGNEVQKQALTPAIEVLRAYEDDNRRRYGIDTEGAHDA